jgi:hypothetical protein
MIVTDLNSKEKEDGYKFVASKCLTQKNGDGLKAMIHDLQRNCLFIASGAGEVFIFNCLPTSPELICKVTTDAKNCIRGMCLSVNCGGFNLSSSQVKN